jgi:hypothetical protein
MIDNLMITGVSLIGIGFIGLLTTCLIIFITNQKVKTMPKRIKGHFVSEWTDGTVKTKCELNTETGELFPETVDVSNDLGSLEKEYFETPDGDELPVCSTCHEFILKTAMFPAVGKSLVEGSECSNLDCDSKE